MIGAILIEEEIWKYARRDWMHLCQGVNDALRIVFDFIARSPAGAKKGRAHLARWIIGAGGCFVRRRW